MNLLRDMSDSRLRLLIAVGLLIITTAAYAPVLWNDFINFDDDRYTYDNPQVMDGLSLSGLRWAFTSTWNANWHPLTWISHMLDCEIYGLKPWGHHLTSLLIHLANVVLLFVLLTRLTGLPWRSAFVAALFGVHPLHVESVAWVAERKDVLSTLFFMLTLIAYARYVERRGIKAYLLVFGAFALGLMAKPMLVTLPIVLLLLDIWPLRRLEPAAEGKVKGRVARVSFWTLVPEKLPLLALSVGSSVITVIAQSKASAVKPLGDAGVHLANIAAGYAAYIGKMLWPLKLGVIYPRPGPNLPAWQVAGSAVLLLAITTAVFVFRRSRPYLVFGWLWFLITMVPVIGVVQVGAQFIADRYTYIPLIGLFIAITWGAADLGPDWQRGQRGDRAASPQHSFAQSPILLVPILIVLVFSGLTFRQVGFWRDSMTLFTHTLRVTAPSATAHTNLGVSYSGRGELDEAIRHYEKALEINPTHVNALYNRGNAYLRKRMYDEAIQDYVAALETKPDSPEALTNLGKAYSDMRRYEESEASYRRALESNSEYVPALTGLGELYKNTGRFPEAERTYREVLRLLPNNAESYSSLGVALAAQGLMEEGVACFRRALRIDPRHTGAHVNMANVHASSGEYAEAEREYRLAIKLDPEMMQAHHNLGLMLRRKGDLQGAIAELRKAVEMEPDMPVPHISLATALYQAGDYAGAWKHVHLCRANRGRPPQKFVEMLSAKMPDPGP